MCKQCKKEVGQECKAISCDRCTSWVHLGCTDLQKKEYDFLVRSSSTGFRWYCKLCEDETGKNADPNDRIAEQGAKIDTMNAMFMSLQQQVMHILEILRDEERIEKKIHVQVSEVLEDQREKEEKKNSMIVFNIPESGEGEGADTEKERELDVVNVKKVLNFVNPEVNVETLNESTVFRLGQKKNTKGRKPRPLRVIFDKPELRSKLIKEAKKLKNHSTFKGVGLSFDKTRKELDQERKLKAELIERRNKGDDVVIHKGLIVLRETLTSTSRKDLAQDSDPSGETTNKNAQ